MLFGSCAVPRRPVADFQRHEISRNNFLEVTSVIQGLSTVLRAQHLIAARIHVSARPPALLTRGLFVQAFRGALCALNRARCRLSRMTNQCAIDCLHGRPDSCLTTREGTVVAALSRVWPVNSPTLHCRPECAHRLHACRRAQGRICLGDRGCRAQQDR